jgi:hypothetical protein
MSRVVWRQFLLAIAVIVLYQMLWSIQGYQNQRWLQESFGSLPLATLKWIPRSILFALPFAPGVALALLPIRPGAFRQAFLLVGGVTAFLVFNDLALSPAWKAYDAATTVPDSASAVRPLRFADTTGAITASLAHLRGKVKPEDIQKWPPDTSGGRNPGFEVVRSGARVVRMSAAMSFNQFTDLLMPFLGAGLVLGIGAWLRNAVTFRRPRDEAIFRLLSAWVIVPAAIMFVMGNQRGMWYDLSSESVWMVWLFVPPLCGLIPAFLGWRAVWRLDRLGAE